MKRLTELCSERNISVERLAAEAGTSASNVRSLLEGRTTPRVELAIRIAQYLGVSVESIDWSANPDASSDGTKSDPVEAA